MPKIHFFLQNSLGYRLPKYLNFTIENGTTSPFYRFYKQYTDSWRTHELFRCFYFKDICVILNDREGLNGNKKAKKQLLQEVFIFNASYTVFHGVIYRNYEAKDGKFVSNVLPIPDSPYLILGFTTTSSWGSKEDTRLLRVDYSKTNLQFRYNTRWTAKQLSCYSLLYIDYTRYFVASFSSTGAKRFNQLNGVMLYDLTSRNQSPWLSFSPQGSAADYDQIAFLEAGRVLLMVDTKRTSTMVYGYTIRGPNQLYHIKTVSVARMIAFKSSNYFAVIKQFQSKGNVIVIYNLGGKVLHVDLKAGFGVNSVVYSEYFGNLLVLSTGFSLTYPKDSRFRNPACYHYYGASYSFSNFRCSKCSSVGAISKRGICDYYLRGRDEDYLVYFNLSIPDLPTNFDGQLFELNYTYLKGRLPGREKSSSKNSSLKNNTNSTQGTESSNFPFFSLENIAIGVAIAFVFLIFWYASGSLLLSSANTAVRITLALWPLPTPKTLCAR